MRRVKAWDGVRAWRFIRASKAYRDAWRARGPLPGLPERAPFPVRLQTAADLAARRWGLLAWEDPSSGRAARPFWSGIPMLDGRVTRDALPLAALAAEGGAALSGLRLGDGALVLRIERDGRAVQVRLAGGAQFPEDGGLLLVRQVRHIEDVWAAVPGPWPGRARGAGTTRFCWRWKARPRGSRTGRSRCASGARRASMRNTNPTAGCIPGSSAGCGAERRSRGSTGTWPREVRPDGKRRRLHG